jgi:predicted transposase/invertase (TIGR01784 family)
MIQEFSDEEYLVDMKEKSRKEGREEGEKRAKIEIAKNLLSAKVNINTIVISTGLSVEEIETIKDKE